MQLNIESDAVYLVLPGARSRAVGHFYLSASATPNKTYKGQFNAPIHTECHLAAEAECAVLFYNCMVAVGIQHALAGLGHPQQQTDIV